MLHKYFLIIFLFQTLPPFSFSETTNKKKPFHSKGLLVTRYGCEENEQKILHKYAINQVTQCESEPRNRNNKYSSDNLFESQSYNINRIQVYATF